MKREDYKGTKLCSLSSNSLSVPWCIQGESSAAKAGHAAVKVC